MAFAFAFLGIIDAEIAGEHGPAFAKEWDRSTQGGGIMKALTPWRPLHALARRDMFDDFFREFLGTREGEAGALEPAAEVSESDGDVTVKLEVPGVEKDQLHVSVTEDEVTVRGETRKKTEEKKNYYRQEIHYGAFQRTVALPTDVDPAKASAELKQGILRITLPKAEQAKARRVDVSVR
jgi:HSP20 family protein